MKLLAVPTADGKLTPELVAARITAGRRPARLAAARRLDLRSRPSSAPSTRRRRSAPWPTLAHEHEMFLHVDGARLANAAAALDLPLRALTTDAGVDVLSFGGTKNGLLLGDAVVFLRPELRARLPLHPQAIDAARLQDAVPRGAVRRPARRRPVAPKRLARQRDGPPPRRGDLAPSTARRARLPGGGERRLRHPARRRRSSACATRSRPSSPSTSGTRPTGTIRLMCSWDTTEEDVDGLACGRSRRRYRDAPARIAQLVEHLHGKEGVVGSSPTPGFSRALRGLAL